jgi:hypothetical protein
MEAICGSSSGLPFSGLGFSSLERALMTLPSDGIVMENICLQRRRQGKSAGAIPIMRFLNGDHGKAHWRRNGTYREVERRVFASGVDWKNFSHPAKTSSHTRNPGSSLDAAVWDEVSGVLGNGILPSIEAGAKALPRQKWCPSFAPIFLRCSRGAQSDLTIFIGEAFYPRSTLYRVRCVTERWYQAQKRWLWDSSQVWEVCGC